MKAIQAIKKYFLGVVKEIRRIRWPNASTLAKASATVIIFGSFFALALFGFDWLVVKMLQSIGFM
jgi:preprotein translocase SecE subunit